MRSEAVEMATARPLTYRALLALARERLGASAAALKTREELLQALGLEADAVTEGSPALVTRDFFIEKKKF